MNFKTVLKWAFIGAAVYGAYKFGQRNPIKDEEPYDEPQPIPQKTESDHLREIIEELKARPNKTRSDRDKIELLKVKLKQIEKTNNN